MRKSAFILWLAIVCCFSCGGGSPVTAAKNPSSNLAIVTSVMPDAVLGQDYQVQLLATGGTGVYQWSAKSLPPGLTLEGSGLLHGSIISLGSYAATVKVQSVKLAKNDSEPVQWAEIKLVTYVMPEPAAAPQATASVTLTLTVTAHYVDLSWTEPQTSVPAVGFNCYRSTTAQGPWSQINAVPVTQTTHRDNNVTPGTTYWYYVTALSSSGSESAPSNIVSALVPNSGT